LAQPPSWTWMPGPLLLGIATIWLARRVLDRCDGSLRKWYDLNQGTQAATS